MQAGEAAQLRRNRSGQLVIGEVVSSGWSGCPVGGNRSGQLVSAEGQYCQAGQAAQFIRYFSGQLVFTEAAILPGLVKPSAGIPRSSSGWSGSVRNLPVNSLPHKYQPLQAGEAAQLRRNRSGQLVIAQYLRLVRLPSSSGISQSTRCPIRPTCRLVRPVQGNRSGQLVIVVLSGWSGCPVHPVFLRSTGFRLRSSSCRLVKAAQFRRSPVSSLEVQYCRLVRFRNRSVNSLSAIGPVLAGWSGCPVLPVSSQSTRCPIRPALAGW